jgi:SAM-dependent methyltransferase
LKAVFKSYAKYYDIIYSDKNYEKECDFLEEIFSNYSKITPKKILDGGCGTGGHAIPLAERGYDVTGIDLSEEMINIAKEKARKRNVNIDFYVMDLRDLKLSKKFDACILMFSVIDYLTDTKDLLKTLTNIREVLKNDSLLIFDFWYGPAVITNPPTPRMKIIEKEDLKIIRFAEPFLNTLHHTCEVNYHLIVTKKDKIMYEGREKHTLRFYFPEEIKHYLEESSFQLLKLCPFLNLNGQPSEKTWHVTAIAQAVQRSC